jgi:hypothetical protein
LDPPEAPDRPYGPWRFQNSAGDDGVAVLEGEQVVVAGDKVVRLSGEKGAEHRQRPAELKHRTI